MKVKTGEEEHKGMCQEWPNSSRATNTYGD